MVGIVARNEQKKKRKQIHFKIQGCNQLQVPSSQKVLAKYLLNVC